MTEAADLMDEPEFIEHDADIEEVVEKVRGVEDTLIVTENGKIVGEIHESSLMKLLIPEKKIDEEKVIGFFGFGFNSKYVAENAEDLMDDHNVKVKPDTDIGNIAFLMDKEDLRAIPVISGDEIVGVVHENRMVEEI